MIYEGYFDGASKNNPGISGIGLYIKHKNKIIYEYSEVIGQGTNNEAEYKALIKLLEEMRNLDAKEIRIYGDSQLVINQINRKWKIKEQHLYQLFLKANDIIEDIKQRGIIITIEWIPREKNKYADKLSNLPLTIV